MSESRNTMKSWFKRIKSLFIHFQRTLPPVVGFVSLNARRPCTPLKSGYLQGFFENK
jgi:hypothetical protein